MEKQIRNPFLLVSLFLVPALIIMVIYTRLADPIMNAGYANIIAFSIAATIVMITVFPVIILIRSKKERGCFSFKDMVLYKNPLPIKHYFWIVPILIAWAGGVFTALKGFDTFLRSSLFSWFPEKLIFSADYTSYDKPQLLLIFLVTIIFIGIIGPVIEEIFFRGFLLPRMEWMGFGAPILNAFLFSLYHFWSPWQFITRFLAIIPLCCVTYRLKNIKVAIVMHCLLNIIGDGAVILILLLK